MSRARRRREARDRERERARSRRSVERRLRDQERELSSRTRKQRKRRRAARDVYGAIGFETMWRDGICEVERGLFSQTVSFSDVSYQSARQEAQEAIFLLNGKLRTPPNVTLINLRPRAEKGAGATRKGAPAIAGPQAR